MNAADSSLEAIRVVSALAARGQTVATSESLTGGLIGAALTAVPGASAVYLGGMIVYTTAIKERLAGVPCDLLEANGPVSAQTASELATRARAATGADWGISATGVAGPEPLDGHPPGEVWLGLAGPSGAARAIRLDLTGDRAAIRRASVRVALAELAEAVTAG